MSVFFDDTEISTCLTCLFSMLPDFGVTGGIILESFALATEVVVDFNVSSFTGSLIGAGTAFDDPPDDVSLSVIGLSDFVSTDGTLVTGGTVAFSALIFNNHGFAICLQIVRNSFLDFCYLRYK